MKRKRKEYVKTLKWEERVNKMTDWSKRNAIYSLRYDDHMKAVDIAKLYKISRARVYKILSDCKIRIAC